MSKKDSKLLAIVQMKCPQCHEGDLFETSTFSFKKPFEMPEQCPVCGQNYLPEPGFYYGSMFISYIIVGWASIFFIMFFHWVLDFNLWISFLLLLIALAIFYVFIFRFSRSVWINLMVKYKGK